jgi:pilus assembly protein FimV
VLLLELDAGDDDLAFERAAEALREQIDDPNDPRWAQVRRMGARRSPSSPLFAADADGVAADDVALSNAEAVTGEPGLPQMPAAEESFDFSESFDGAATPDAQAAEEDFRWESPQASDTDAAARSEEQAPGMADDDAAIESAPASEPEMPPASSGEEGEDEVEDAVGTKLELARAYLDIGDVEGARGMLEEVTLEGTPGQQAEARRLLDEIG